MAGLAAALSWGLRAAPADAQGRAAPRNPAAIIATYLAAHPHSAESVRFDNAGWPAVRVVRGGGWRPPASPARILRGGGSAAGRNAGKMEIETVRFANPAQAPVTVIRGPAISAVFAPLGPPGALGLGRIAFAVDGVESRHGADPGMWRADLAGPQGPMQVSLAAARDVGGGDRFDPARNRALGRAYLAHLYRRYGNWADAVMAYNWGPANLDLWIAAGRPAGRLPAAVERYRDQVLEAAGLAPVGQSLPPSRAAGAVRDGSPPQLISP